MSLRTRLTLAVLLLLLAACGAPQPMESPVMRPQMYLPLIAHKSPRKAVGVSGGLWGLNADWYYHWTVSPNVTDKRFVPMVWCPIPAFMAVQQANVIARAKMRSGQMWLLGNEPEHTSQCGGMLLPSGKPVFTAPREYAREYLAVARLIRMYDPVAVILTGGIYQIGTPHGAWWWGEFVAELQRLGHTPDGAHIHAYPCQSVACTSDWGMPELLAALDDWYATEWAGRGYSGPVWITEVGSSVFCQNYTAWDTTAWTDIRDNVMIPFQDWMATSDYATAAWFVSWDGLSAPWWCNYLIDARQTPASFTPLGDKWTR